MTLQWNYFVHAGEPCDGTPLIKLLDFGPSGEARYLQVSCETCDRSRRLADAYGNDNLENLPPCMGRRPHLRDYEAELCAGDPLCANHKPEHDERSIRAAACHDCLFAPETSCERGNKYLDRAVLVPTIEESNLAFFPVDAHR